MGGIHYLIFRPSGWGRKPCRSGGQEKDYWNIKELDNYEWELVLGINPTGLMYCVRAQLRVMKSGASIVNAASVAGGVGRPNMCAYQWANTELFGLTNSIAKEDGSRGIRVNCIGPLGSSTLLLPVSEAKLNAIAEAESKHLC